MPVLGKLAVGPRARAPATQGSLFPLQQSDSRQDSSPEDTSFMLEVESLRKMFLQRPDCPQFCTRATSMSHYGETHQGGPPPVPGWTLLAPPACGAAPAASNPPGLSPAWGRVGTEGGPPAALAVGNPLPASWLFYVHAPEIQQGWG